MHALRGERSAGDEEKRHAQAERDAERALPVEEHRRLISPQQRHQHEDDGERDELSATMSQSKTPPGGFSGCGSSSHRLNAVLVTRANTVTRSSGFDTTEERPCPNIEGSHAFAAGSIASACVTTPAPCASNTERCTSATP